MKRIWSSRDQEVADRPRREGFSNCLLTISPTPLLSKLDVGRWTLDVFTLNPDPCPLFPAIVDKFGLSRGRVFAIIGVILVVALLGCGTEDSAPAGVAPPPERIVSMSPALTETLFALGVGDRVVGVTRFCLFPEETLEIPKVGGYLDPNWEAIVALEPDLVVLMESHAGAESRLSGLGIRTVRVNQQNVADILASFQQLADVCGVPDRGEALRAEVEQSLERIRSTVEGRSEPRVIVSVGREPGSGRLAAIWAAGPGTFLDDALRLAGGINVVPGGVVGAYPEITTEGLLHLDPDDILDVIPELETSGIASDAALADWQSLEAVRAVREERVHVLGRHCLSIPGPRVAEVVEAFARALHPEVEWW